MYCVSLQVLYLGLRLWTSVRYVLSFSSGIVPWATIVDFGQICIVFLFSCIFLWATTVDLGQMCIVVFFRYWTMRYDCGFGQACIVFLFMYCTLGYDCGLRSGMYCVSLQVFYLGLRPWTSVRYVLCFSSGILSWIRLWTSVRHVLCFRYCTLAILIDWLIDFSYFMATSLSGEWSRNTQREPPTTGSRYHLRLRVECTLFCNLQSWARTHAALVILVILRTL
jgi:hypothetical protein